MTRRGTVDGVEVVLDHGDVDAEVACVRRSVGLSRLDHVAVLRVVGDEARAFLGRVLASDLRVRDGQVRPTLLLDEHGVPLADAYVCNDDERYLLLVDGMPRGALLEHLREHLRGDVAVEDLSESHVLLSLNGPYAWELTASLEGDGVVGFPYLSFYHAADRRLVIRAGKTGEFGYDLVVPRGDVGHLTDRVLTAGRRFDLREVGLHALWRCALENWFFNPHRQRAADVTPIELGLQWRVARNREFVGSRALEERRALPGGRRATALTSPGALAPGDAVLFEGHEIGTVLDAHHAPSLGHAVAMALLDRAYAHSGIDRYTVNGTHVRTVSPPFVENLSLTVNPQKDSYSAQKPPA